MAGDFEIINHGTIYTVRPLNADAALWADENIETPDWARLGGAIAVDHRCAGPLIEGIVEAGFVIGDNS